MAWDDTAPTKDELGSTQGAGWDATPPTKDELPQWSDLPGNIIPDLKEVGKGALDLGLRTGKGILDLPEDVMHSGEQIISGANPLDTPLGQDAKTVGSGVLGAVKAIPKQLGDLVSKEAWIKHPVQNSMTVGNIAAPFLGGEAEAGKLATGIPKAAEETLAKDAATAGLKELPIEKAPPVIPMGEKGPIPEPASRMPPDPNAPILPKPPVKADPLQDVKDFLAKTQGKIEAKPGWQEKAAKYVKNEVADLRGKDIGMRDPMIRSMDPKHPLKALEKAESLMNYAGEQGYFKPGLTDVARKEMIAKRIDQAGQGVGAVRDLALKRAQPPIEEVRNAIKSQLTEEYGHKAPREIQTVLGDFDRIVAKDPSFSGLADAATYLNSQKTPVVKMSQHPGPTTDAANIISQMNNDAIRKVLSPEENAFYTKNLRDFGAHKKLEQMVASAGRRQMTGRGAPGGPFTALWQQLWDRGGYRAAGNTANRMSTWVLKNPGKIKTIPQFFEEFAHHAGDELDDTIHGATGMAKGGIVPDDVRRYVSHQC